MPPLGIVLHIHFSTTMQQHKADEKNMQEEKRVRMRRRKVVKCQHPRGGTWKEEVVQQRRKSRFLDPYSG
jgi:hypothetical protein